MNVNCRTAFAIALMSLAACGGGGGTGATGAGTGTGNGGGNGAASCTPGNGIICVLDASFSPVDITIPKNGSVTFTEQAGVHRIVFDPFQPSSATGVADIGAFSEGSVARTFTTVGTFPYHCTIHGGVGTGMHGTITVQ